MQKLSPEEVSEHMQALPQWSLNGDSLQRTLAFEDFAAAMVFVNRLAELAEQVQHHPDIMVRYNKVTLTLTSHDAGGLTERDFDLARSMDEETAQG